jgi:hypothetical protein
MPSDITEQTKSLHRKHKITISRTYVKSTRDKIYLY